MIRVRVIFEGVQGGPWLATHYFSGDGTGGEAQLAVNRVGALWGVLDTYQVSGMTWRTDPEVAAMSTTTGDITAVIATTPATGAGATAVNMLPAQVQGFINWTTGVFINGRRVRGRTFWPGLTENNNTGLGVPTGLNGSDVQTAIATFVSATSPNVGVWSRQGGVHAGILSGTVPTKWGTLRSRRD
jgi:hypothetical protein